MLDHPTTGEALQQGTTLLEVLITIVILAFGLLGLAGLQSKMTLAELESYQRGQAVLVLNDMVGRISANRGNAQNYVSGTTFGTGDTTQPTSCATLATRAAQDQCEWSKALQGAAETSGTAKVGAMIGAKGCITQIQAANSALGVCTPGVYQIAVAWQGLNLTVAPSVSCGQNSYGDERYRRVLSTNLAIGLPTCY